jgi:hypothetical protein
MRHLVKLQSLKAPCAAGALALGVLASAPWSSAMAADMGVPYGPPPVEQGYYPPPVAPAPPPVVYDYPAPLPSPYYYTAYGAAPPYVVPGPYYWGRPYWRGYGPRFAYGYGHWGHWHR